MFQFTHPGRGATKTEHTDSIVLGVSIHAPREGCDFKQIDLAPDSMFQFTHPGRGATGHRGQSEEALVSFNSRTPGGVRLHGG